MSIHARVIRYRMSIRAGLLLFGLGAAMTAGAQTLLFHNFSSTTGLSLNGDAETVGAAGSEVLRLVPSNESQVGSAFTTSQVNISGFSTAFQFRLSNRGGIDDASEQVGGDGFTFVVQTAGSTEEGGLGLGLGYSGITPSVAVEFDTYFNPGDDPSPSSTGTNHAGVNLGGSVASVATALVPTRLDNGALWTAWVDYDGTTLEVRLSTDGLRPTSALLSHSISITGQLDSTAAFVGFTAGTGAAHADHDILNWAFSPTYVVGGIAAVPEPGTIALLALGALMLLGARRFRRAR